MSKYRVILFTLLLFAAGVNAQQLEHQNISQISTFKHLAPEALLLEDAEKELTFKDILFDKAIKDRYFQSQDEVPYMDFTSSNYWMKLKVENDTTVDRRYYIELARPLTNLVNLYVFDENNDLIDTYHGGDDLPFEDRPYLHRKFVIPVDFPAKSKRTLIVKTSSDGEILKLPLKFWEIDSFTQFASFENFFLGLYYGFLLLVFVLFSFFGYALKEKIYIFFVLYIFALGLFQFALDGLAFQFLWPHSSWMANHSILFLAAISGLALLAYADHFLEFRELNKKFYNFYKLLYLLVAVSAITSLTSGKLYALTYPVLNGLSFIYICSFFVGLYYRSKSGKKPSIEISLAFGFLWLGAIFFILANVNIIENEFLASNAIKIGSAFEVTFLSLAMAGRYRNVQQEKLSAQERAFAALEEVNELKSEQTEKLEKQVKQRTEEISKKNEILSVQNKEIINSINYAKRLQDVILPSKKLMKAVFKESSIFYRPKDIVSGDFYWLETTKTHSFFAVADCTGHGVPGALVSVVGYNALNRCVNEMKLTDPGEILDKLRELVEHTFSHSQKKVSDGMDICLCVWDNENTLQFAGAFNPLYLFRDGELQEIKADRQPVGRFIRKAPFTSHKIELKEKDSIYLFSDGYPDQFGGEKGKKLKSSGFKEYLLLADKMNAQEGINELEERFEAWKGDLEQIDDVCILNVRF